MLMIDIPMPERCTTCQFRFVSYLYGDMRCAMSGKITNLPLLDRHPDCPLVEVTKCEDCEHYTSVTAHCEVRGKGLYLIRGKDDWCSRGIRREE